MFQAYIIYKGLISLLEVFKYPIHYQNDSQNLKTKLLRIQFDSTLPVAMHTWFIHSI